MPRPRPTNTVPCLVLTSWVLVASACAVLEIPAAPGSVLFQDDFALETSGWDRYQDPNYQAGYADGAYRLRIETPNTWAWATPRVSLSDVRIEVDTVRRAGPDNNVFGLVCRYQDWRNYVFFLASSDGYVGIGIRREGENALLSADSLQLRDVVSRGDGPNHLRADCIGDDFELSVNGFPVASAQTSAWAVGDVGLLAGSYGQGGVEIDFDNYSVLQP